MSITDELREYADTLSERARYGATIPSPLNPHSGAPIGPTKETEELYTIADRIDIEHERELAKAREKGMCDTLEVLETGWIELPKDANGEYIHIGDRMEHIELGYVLEVIAVGVVCFTAWNTHLNRYCQYDSKLFRHHHEPTIEDVLREFGDKYCDMVAGSDKERELFAEYAAKLQLRGEDE